MSSRFDAPHPPPLNERDKPRTAARSISTPPLEAGENVLLRAMEAQAHRPPLPRAGQRVALYDGLSTFSHPIGEAEKKKPSFASVVRKVMSAQQAPVAPNSAALPRPHHIRRRSNAEAVYNMLNTEKDASAENPLMDVFHDDVFHSGKTLVTSSTSGQNGAFDNYDGHHFESEILTEIEHAEMIHPMDSTPLLGDRAAANLWRLRKEKQLCGLYSIQAFFWGLLLHCWMVAISAVLSVVALILFYKWNNPSLDALPGHATLAWWCNFVARQLVTFEMARVLKYVIIDCFILGSAFSRIVGPFVTLLSLQAKGWPFVITAWGILDIVLLQGDNVFQNHWLYFTGWSIYNYDHSSGRYILTSEPYLRMLLCFIVLGSVTAVKRTMMAISFGRRQYGIFKPRLEKLLLDVVLLNEVASLSAQAEAVLNAEERVKTGDKTNHAKVAGGKHTPTRALLGEVSWNSVRMKQGALELDESDHSEDKSQASRGFDRSQSSESYLKDLLDRWQEPVKQDLTEVTIQDVLRFRRALAFMDTTYPFGEDFGLGSTRDEAIASAEAIFLKLRRLSNETDRLPFDTLALIALQEDDTYDALKRKALRRLFEPNMDNTLTLLQFVQSCDTIYRRLRYFLATVNNSAALDKVLESVLNSLYYFVMTLFLLSLMNYNAWSILVSMTSLLVSFSFAFGQTVSRYVQGILLIAVTRPFDLGDRIFLTPASDVPKELENAAHSYFVEDITLSTTKLRYAKTGEVAYLGNHLIADMKIYNGNRSLNATVTFPQMFHIAILGKEKMRLFEESLRNYVCQHPRRWVDMLLFRVDTVDNDMEQVFLQMSFQHRESWQNAPRIFLHRSELILFIFETAKKMKIAFESPPPRRVIYHGGDLDQGTLVSEADHRTDLLRPANVITSSSRERSNSASTVPPFDKLSGAQVA